MTRPQRLRLRLRLLTATALLLPAAATAQSQPTPPPQTPPATSAPAPTTPPAPAASSTPTPITPPQLRVAVDASGGPSTLADDVAAAIQAWSEAAPELVSVEIAADAPSTVTYAPPALLGPDTLSLDRRVPGQPGVRIELSAKAPGEHPTVLLHEIGVLLGLPEGGAGVMALGVPATGAPTAPEASDVAALRAHLTYAPEDLDRNGTVDFHDLVLFGQAFGRVGVNLPADFNGDGKVDAADLALLEKAYTFTPPSASSPAGQAPSTPSTPAEGQSPASGAAPAAPTDGTSPSGSPPTGGGAP